MERICVERVAEDRWRVWPQDETWLPLVTKHALQEDATSVAAVLKEHPQHEGVLLRGDQAALLRGIGALHAALQAMRRKGLGALRCESYDTANMLRRTLLTRPLCLAAEAVHFTAAVVDSEYEPIAAHRIGQLTFCAEAAERLAPAEVQLLVPPGEWAFARHLQLPPGLRLASGQGDAAIGLRAVPGEAEGGRHLMATVELSAESVFFSKHAKHCAVAAVSYRPEVRLAAPFPRGCAETLRRAGFSFAQSGVVDTKTTLCRQEFVAQLLPSAVFLPPRHVQLDFEALARSRKEAVLDDALARLLEEIGCVEEQLRSAEVVAESRCPDSAQPRTFGTA
jgi:hypothetical protein